MSILLSNLTSISFGFAIRETRACPQRSEDSRTFREANPVGNTGYTSPERQGPSETVPSLNPWSSDRG